MNRRVRRVSVSKGSLKSRQRPVDGAEDEDRQASAAVEEDKAWLSRRQLRRPQRSATVDAPVTSDNELLRAFRARGKTFDESI